MYEDDPMKSLTGRPPTAQQQYRATNAASGGGKHPAYMAQDFINFSAKSEPIPNRQANREVPRDPYNPLTARKPTAPFMLRPHESRAGAIANLNKGFNRVTGSDPWADKVNRMSDGQFDQAMAPGTADWQRQQSPANVASNPRWSSVPNGIAVAPGSMYPTTPRGRIASDGLDNAFTWPMSQSFAQNAVQALSNTPQQRQGFSMDPIAPMNLPMQRSEVPAWSLDGGVNPETESAFRDFQSMPMPPSLNIGKVIEDRIMQNLATAGAEGRQAVNGRVDGNLAASDRLGRTMGGGDYRAAGRTGVIPPRGMGGLPSDAGVMSRLTQPLGDGGPAAYAARADQDKRRSQAEAAMGGVGADGLTRYMPNQDLLAFANQDRASEDQRISALIGGGTQMRQPMKAMTPSEIQFYRHKMSMLTNPAYANRVNAQRADRQEMLDNRRNMVRARREGALEAAGASQQMRNVMAGRGAVGPGADGMGALMGLTAQMNPALALNQGNQMAMMDRRAQLERDLMDRATKMAIYSSGMSGPEMDLALQRLDAANNGTPITSPLQIAGGFKADPNASPRDRYLAAQSYFDSAEKQGAKFTDEQKRQIMASQGINPSAAEIQGWRQDAAGTFESPNYIGSMGPGGDLGGTVTSGYIIQPLLEMLGLDPASLMESRRRRQALKP